MNVYTFPLVLEHIKIFERVFGLFFFILLFIINVPVRLIQNTKQNTALKNYIIFCSKADLIYDSWQRVERKKQAQLL